LVTHTRARTHTHRERERERERDNHELWPNDSAKNFDPQTEVTGFGIYIQYPLFEVVQHMNYDLNKNGPRSNNT